jgi:hypothetical protein
LQFNPADDGQTGGVVCGNGQARPLYVSNEGARILRPLPKQGDALKGGGSEEKIKVL